MMPTRILPGSKPAAVWLIDMVADRVEESELQQWNELHAAEFGDYYHTVHKGDRVLKVNSVSALDDPKDFCVNLRPRKTSF